MFRFSLNLRAIVAMAFMFVAALVPAAAQTPPGVIDIPLAVGTVGYGVIEAGDGNLYAMSVPSAIQNTCGGNSSDICSYIYQIHGTTLTNFHSFQPVSSASGSSVNTDGYFPTALITGTDGNLYGACKLGGPGGFGTIFRITPGGTFSVLVSFGVTAGKGIDPGNVPQGLIQGIDGNLYFVNASGVYSISPNGTSSAVTTVATFPYGLVEGSDPYGYNASSIMQAGDGNFYLTMGTTPGTLTGDPGVNAGGIVQLTPGGQLKLVHAFALDGSEGNLPQGPLVEGPDGYLYGLTNTSTSGGTTAGGLAFKVLPGAGGAFLSLGSLPSTTGAGSLRPSDALFVGSDGNLYGTTELGGNLTAAHCAGVGCGMLFRMTPAGTFSTVYAFQGGSAASPNAPPLQPEDGAVPEAPVVQGDDGGFYGGSAGFTDINSPTFFEIDMEGALPGPVKLTVSPTIAALNTPVTVSWGVSNAFSDTAQNCGAVVKGGLSGINGWSGQQTGSLANGIYSGSTTITPTQPGAYILALVCGGNVVGFADLTVSAGLSISTPAFPDAQVNVTYSGAIEATGGTGPYNWTFANIPPGLTDAGGGSLFGKPTQFGNYTLPVTVTDSSTPPLQFTGTVTLKVISGLNIKTPPATVKATQNSNFGLGVDVVGGLPPYTWTVTAGSLPDGLQLLSVGAVGGKPTTVGNSTFTLQVADNEATPATQTITFTIKVVSGIQIAAVEFTQAIQQFQYLDDLEASLTANGEPPVPMISSKHAVMRIYFTRVEQATNVVLMASGAATEQRQFNIPPYCEPESQRSHQSPKNCPSIDIYFDPPSGPWSEVLTLNDDSGNQLEQETLNITSRDALAINLRSVWVCTTPGQPTSCQDPSSLLTLKAFAEKVLPTASVTLTPTWTHVSEDVSQHAGDTWIEAVIPKIDALYTPQDILTDATSLQRTDYTGVYNHVLAKTGTGVAIIGGHGVLIGDSFHGLDPNMEEATEMVLGHEIGHSLSLTHTGLINPMSASFPGCWALPDVGSLGTNWIYPDNYVQDSQGYETGFDVVANTVIPAMQSFELMSYCEPDWITPLNYKKALLYVNPGPPIAPSVKADRGATAAKSAARPESAITLTQGSYWSVSGTLPNSGGATVAPIFTETMPGSTDPGSGTYSIQELNAAGQPLYTRFFTPSPGAIDPTFGTTTDAPFTDGMFSEFIPVTPSAASIAIIDPTGILLTSIAIAGAPPTVTITSPAAGFAGTGEQAISWNIQSTASGTFTSRIYYSTDNGTTWKQIDETTAMTDVLDFNTLPGASSALIRVDVSDGVNTGSATSVPFSVPKKAPSAIVINSPVSGAIQQAANPVYLTGGAYDADDGVLTGTALEWSDSVQGSLGSGSPLVVTLKPGSHTITLTATDSDGNALTATTQITLGGGAPVISLTTSQNSTCYSAIINATPGASGAVLTVVNFTIDGGATYTPIALASLPFTLPLSGTGIVDIAAVAVDASGQVGAQSTELNLGSGCTATTLSPHGGSGQNTLIGTAFTTALSTLVVDQSGNPVSGATVTYAAPASGASATLSAATATTNSSGIATTTATANSTAGSYSITATASTGASTATFALTNTDFQVSAASPTLDISRGSSATDTITLSALDGFNGTVSFTCSGLADATCTFSPSSITPTGASSTTTMTVAAAASARVEWPWPSTEMLACMIFAFCYRRRRYVQWLSLGFALAIGLTALGGCGSSPKQTPPVTSTVTVTAASGSTQRTTTITVQIGTS